MRLLLGFVLCFFMFGPLIAGEPASVAPASDPAPAQAASPAPAPVPNTANQSTVNEDNFSPGAAIFLVLLALVVMVIVVILGVLLAALAGLILFLLLAFGLLTTSAFMGAIARKPRVGFKSLFIQLGALTGIPVGIVLVYLSAFIADLQWPHAYLLTAGAIAGFVAGVLFAWMFNTSWEAVLNWIVSKFKRGKETGIPEPEVADWDEGKEV